MTISLFFQKKERRRKILHRFKLRTKPKNVRAQIKPNKPNHSQEIRNPTEEKAKTRESLGRILATVRGETPSNAEDLKRRKEQKDHKIGV